MATLVADGILIKTDTGNGIPVAGPIAALGLNASGNICLITGRPGLDGSLTVTGDTDEDVWHEGILALDYAAWAISQSADFKVAGCVSSVSGFSFSVVNAAGYHRDLSDNDINLGRRRVERYRFTSTDGNTWVAKLEWSGVIDEMPWDVLAYDFKCVDATKDIFRSAPNIPVTVESFSDSPAESQNKMIPVALGRVAYSPLVNITKPGAKAVLNVIGGIDYEMAAVRTVSSSGFRLITLGTTFIADDPRLFGKYVGVVSGGKPQAYRIRSVYPTGDVANTTFVYTDEPPDMTGFVSWDADHNGVGDDGVAGVWYVEITDYKPTLIASTLDIGEVKNNAAGRAGLALYKGDRNVFDDISEVISESSLDDISDSGFPGYSILAKSADTDGSLFTYFNIFPTDIKVVAVTSWDTENLPAVGASAPLLFDRTSGGGYVLGDSPTSSPELKFDVFLPTDEILKQFEELYVLLDFAHAAPLGGSVFMSVDVQMMDFYGRVSETVVNNYILVNGGIPASLTDFNMLPREYYGLTGDNSVFHFWKAGLNIASLIGDNKKSRAYNAIRITISFTFGGGLLDYDLNLNQIGVVGKRSVGVTSETVYGTIRGETFGRHFAAGPTWGGRKNYNEPIDTGVEAIEHLIRKYDETAEFWEAGLAVVVGKIVRPTADAGYLYVCTVAGTTHASAEPTWPTTTGGTVSDGTATWKLLREIPADTETFDAANAQRDDWLIGATLQEKKSTLEYYKDLCAQMFLIMLVDATGKIKLKAWRENTTHLVNFSIANGNIIERSFGKKTYTPESEAYNDIRIRYDFNYGSNKYNRQLTVTNADQPAFPASDNPLWTQYVSGVQDYDVAAGLWNDAHASYVITKKINKLPESLGDCPFFFDPRAKDAAGKLIWSADGVTPDLDVGDAHSAVYFARNMLQWGAFQKPVNTFEAPDSAMTVTDPNTSQPRRLEIGDPVGFLHAEYTDGENRVGWVQQIDEVPRTADEPRRFRLSIIMEPE